MIGIDDLGALMQQISPQLHSERFCFVSLSDAQYGEFSSLNPIASFQEEEGLTLVIPREKALKHGYEHADVFSCITLRIHSSLIAVGLSAAVSSKLAEHNISVNIIAGFYHDHLFVPESDGQRACDLLHHLGDG